MQQGKYQQDVVAIQMWEKKEDNYFDGDINTQIVDTVRSVRDLKKRGDWCGVQDDTKIMVNAR